MRRSGSEEKSDETRTTDPRCTEVVGGSLIFGPGDELGEINPGMYKVCTPLIYFPPLSTHLQVPPRESSLRRPVKVGEIFVGDDPLSGFEVLQLQ